MQKRAAVFVSAAVLSAGCSSPEQDAMPARVVQEAFNAAQDSYNQYYGPCAIGSVTLARDDTLSLGAFASVDPRDVLVVKASKTAYGETPGFIPDKEELTSAFIHEFGHTCVERHDLTTPILVDGLGEVFAFHGFNVLYKKNDELYSISVFEEAAAEYFAVNVDGSYSPSIIDRRTYLYYVTAGAVLNAIADYAGLSPQDVIRIHRKSDLLELVSAYYGVDQYSARDLLGSFISNFFGAHKELLHESSGS